SAFERSGPARKNSRTAQRTHAVLQTSRRAPEHRNPLATRGRAPSAAPVPPGAHRSGTSLKERIRQRALELGFDDCRFTTAAAPDHAEKFRTWIAGQQHGQMA